MICGDLNTTLGTLLAWKVAYENANDSKEFQIKIHQALQQQNKHGDYMLSQGFSTTHVESTIGSSENSRKHCSDSHNMLTLRGHRVPPKAKETLHARTGRELKPEHYDTSAAQPRAVANTCTGQVPAPHRQWSLPDNGNEDVVVAIDQQTGMSPPEKKRLEKCI